MHKSRLITILLAFGFIQVFSQERDSVSYYKNDSPVSQNEIWDKKVVFETGKSGEKMLTTYGRDNNLMGKIKTISKGENSEIESETYHSNGFISVNTITKDRMVSQCLDPTKKVFFKEKECLVHVPDNETSNTISRWFGINFRNFITDYPTENIKTIAKFSISPQQEMRVIQIGSRIIENEKNLTGLYKDIYKAILAIPKIYYPNNFDLIGNEKMDRIYTLPIHINAQ